MTDQATHGKTCDLILPTTNPARAAAFSSEVINRTTRIHDDGSFAFDDPTVAVSGTWTADRPPAGGGYEVDIMVNDAQAAAAKIMAQGGTVVESPQKRSGAVTDGGYRDPDGNRLGLSNHGAREDS